MANILTFGDHVIGVTQIVSAYLPGQASGSTPDAWPLLKADHDIVVEKVVWVPAAGVTGSDADNFAIGVVNRGADGTGGGAVTDVKTYVAGVNSTANVPEELTISATANLDAGDVLALDRTVNGLGLAQPDGLVQVHYRYR